MKVDFKKYLSILKDIPAFLQKNIFAVGVILIIAIVVIELGYYSFLMSDISTRSQNIDIIEETLDSENIDSIIDAYSEERVSSTTEDIFYKE